MEEEFVVVKQQSAIEVYPNSHGSITIHQINWPDEDAFVVINAEYAIAVANALIDSRNQLSEAQNA